MTFLTPLMAGKNADVRFNVNDPDGNACVSLFADFNADGDFADSGEHAVNQQSYATGNQTATFAVPASAGGVIAVRVRLTDECNQGGQLSTDPAPNGEVEDYLLGEIGDYVWQDADGDGIQQGFELGVSGVVVNLLDGSGDPVLDGDGNPITTTTDANGKYQFTGLPAGNYIIEFVAPTGKDFTQTGQGTAATDSDADTTTGRSGVVNISIREVDHTIDAGLVDEPLPPLDWGDLQDTSTGTGPYDYQTISGDSGPNHIIVSGLRLGAAVDDEFDGQPYFDATGDDAAGSTPDDEDGVTFLTPLAAGTNADVQFNVNAPDGDACVSLFADFTADGDFADSGEHAVNQQTYATGNQTATIVVPAAAEARIAVRVRLTDECSQGGELPTGAALNGEVEDYMLGAIGDFVWPDLNANGNQEFFEQGVNGVVVNLLDGNGNPVLDGDGNPITTTTANDVIANPGYYAFGGLPPGTYIVEFVAPAGQDFTIQNHPGSSEPADSDADTTTGRADQVAIGAGEVNNDIDAGLVDEPPAPTYDFGDLPDTGSGVGAGNYETLLANNGPSHVIVSGLGLAFSPDDESDGQPNATATGDDTAGASPDDEDGVSFMWPLVAGTTAGIAPSAIDSDTIACVSVYVDFNGDGDFADTDEHLINQINFGLGAGGTGVYWFNVPSTARGAIAVRARLTDDCNQGGESPNGAALNGEVEDYILGAIGNYVWNDSDGDGTQNEPASAGQNGVTVKLLDGSGNQMTDYDGDPITTTTANDSSGNPGYYEFAGLPAGNYIVEFVAPSGKDFTQTGQGTAATDSDANVSTGRSGVVAISAGESGQHH